MKFCFWHDEVLECFMNIVEYFKDIHWTYIKPTPGIVHFMSKT